MGKAIPNKNAVAYTQISTPRHGFQPTATKNPQ